MNGIVSEAVYPAVSADHDDLPIRSLYFDKVNTHIDRDLEIFLDLARAYQRRKRQPRYIGLLREIVSIDHGAAGCGAMQWSAEAR